MMRSISLLFLVVSTASAFVVAPQVVATRTTAAPALQMMVDPSSLFDQATTSLMISETDPWVQPLSLVLDPFLNLFSFAMLCRIVLSWYPQTPLNELPWAIVVWPTEALLRLIRGAVPPAFGVDITPIVWLGIFTFFHEILLGQQGLLTMKIKYGI